MPELTVRTRRREVGLERTRVTWNQRERRNSVCTLSPQLRGEGGERRRREPGEGRRSPSYREDLRRALPLTRPSLRSGHPLPAAAGRGSAPSARAHCASNANEPALVSPLTSPARGKRSQRLPPRPGTIIASSLGSMATAGRRYPWTSRRAALPPPCRRA